MLVIGRDIPVLIRAAPFARFSTSRPLGATSLKIDYANIMYSDLVEPISIVFETRNCRYWILIWGE